MSVAARGDVLVVLAGGRSRRFGSDKAVAPFDSEPLALRALRRLSTVAPRRVVVRAAPLAGLPADVVQVADPHPGEGPLQALAAAFAAAPAPRWFVAPCDLPWLDDSIHARLAAEIGGSAVAAARAPDGLEPLVSLWTPPAAERLSGWLAFEPQLAAHAALERLGAAEVEFAEPRPFLNVNTREELELALAVARPEPAPLAAGAAVAPR